MGRIDRRCRGKFLIMSARKQLKRNDESKADAQICLTCPLPFCTGTDKCFRSRKRELNHERTTSEPRETVEELSNREQVTNRNEAEGKR